MSTNSKNVELLLKLVWPIRRVFYNEKISLELKDTVSHVGQKLIETVKNTWNMMYHLAVNKSVDAAESVIQHELSQVISYVFQYSGDIGTSVKPHYYTIERRE